MANNILSIQEKLFLMQLKNVKVQSLWGLAISNVVKNPMVSEVGRLFTDLKSQDDDNDEMMLEILGVDAHFYLQNL